MPRESLDWGSLECLYQKVVGFKSGILEFRSKFSVACIPTSEPDEEKAQ